MGQFADIYIKKIMLNKKYNENISNFYVSQFKFILGSVNCSDMYSL